MTKTHQHSVIVGIDGSESSIRAAQWAADEAIAHSVPLRLVSVVRTMHRSAEEYRVDVDHAKKALQVAQSAVEATGKPAKIEAEILDGVPGQTLVSESRDARMICVGTVGIGRYARSILGSTATELAEKAQCPVAVIRALDGEPRDGITWIVTALDENSDNPTVIESAVEEARLRSAPVLILGDTPARSSLDSTVQACRQRHPDVHIYPVADHADISRFIKKHDEPVQLAVIGASQAGQLADIVGSYGHHRFHHAAASVLVVR